MKPKEALTDLWKKGYFETVKTNKEIDRQLADEYGASTENLTAVLNNCDKFLRKMGKTGWRQRMRYDIATKVNGGKKREYFTLLDIHPRIKVASQKMFLDGYYSQAIFDAFKEVEIMVKEKSGIKGKIGAALMQEAFSANAPVLKINDGVRDSDEDEQKGFMMLFTGAQIGIRNPKGHDNIEQKDEKITMQYLVFASLLCRVVEKSTKTNNRNP